MKTKLFITMVVLFAATISNADAQSIRKNSRHQKVRIAQGIRSGDITRREAHYLAKEQRDLKKNVRRARANDGKVGPRERVHIRKDQRKSKRHIYRARHNHRNRF